MGSLGLRNLVGYLVILVLPAMTFAVTQPVCRCGPVTPESYQWNFSKEAAGLLAQIHYDAFQAKYDASYLASFDHGERDLIDWRIDGGFLTQERHWANDMDQKLCRLRIIERVLPGDQQAEIKSVAPSVIEVTDTTQAAIQFVNKHPDQLFEPRYMSLAPALYNEASKAEAASANSGQYMEAGYTVRQFAAHENPKTGS